MYHLLSKNVFYVRGIHNYRKDYTTQKSTCNPWDFASRTLPIIEKEDERLYGGETEHYKSFFNNLKIS